jgi:hypothetical protein
MVDSPCFHCVHLIGAGSDAAPHASLKIMNFRRDRRGSVPEDLAEFYRCETCKTILVRDLNKQADAKWDWI